MGRPRLLLIPEFTELEWVIKPLIAEWADVASYDPPGVGDEPIDDDEAAALRSGRRQIRDLFVRRGVEEIDRRGWDRFFLVADGWSNATAARIALERPDGVQGIALGHATLSFDMEGERAPVNREVWAGMRQLLRQDHREFIRHAIVQLTRGSLDDQVAGQMLERFPERYLLELTWDSLGATDEPIGEMLRAASRPLLLAKHEGCLGFSDEGFEDAVAAFPDARVMRLPGAPATEEEFARALREFCTAVEEGEAPSPGVPRESAR